ncbi:uncharacterized protein UBRO_02622 [Ustilago bromivora]|uniref:DFDF domain-containing protein n=1 Tax=Ustilago bromivora TaxID=307758 RepID=A0A1K0H1N1_9BASI|nr:uncharacterized protein UBRO_02622 [Ustilago bromivora]SYW77019.1 uncharacterized protein UBRO2_01642 [Ustilago bromivora]
MSSPFVGLNVKITLHSRPGSSLHSKILSIDQASNTLTVQKQDGSQAVLKRTDIASLAAIKPVEPTTKSASSSPASGNPTRNDTATPSKSLGKAKNHNDAEHASLLSKPAVAAPASSDPAIMSFNRSNDATAASTEHHFANHLLAPLQGSDPAGSRSSTPSRSRSPRPKPAAAVQTPKSAKKKQAAVSISRGSSPAIPNAALSDEFDFSAGLKAFDKKKIWDDIRASDHTDPASLLVSHNRIANAPIELIRGPNGVGPANSVSTPDRGRTSVKDGQQKLRPNEMVCSPSPEHVPSPNPCSSIATAKPAQSTQTAASVQQATALVAASIPNKPTYEQLEERVRKLEAELALARRRNALLEELASLGLGVPTRADAASDFSKPSVVSPPVQPNTDKPATDAAVATAEKDLSNMSLQSSSTPPAAITASAQEQRSSTPASLSNALAAAGFNVSSQTPSAASTPAPATPSSISVPIFTAPKDAAAEKEEPLFGHIVDPPVLTLLFPTAALQHAALARMEAFYESDFKARSYLTLQQAANERICRNYQGFNFPVRQGVQEWLDAMYEATSLDDASDDTDAPKWWAPHCSNEENQLLDVLVSLGAISPYEGASSRSEDSETGNIKYVISCVASQAHSTLPHELLHALYFLSAPYRSFVTRQYASLSSANKKVIETDLGMRKYSPSVFEDEFQAYLAEGLGTEKEFGNKPAAECKAIADALRAQVPKEWKKLGLDLEGGKQQEKWEDVKWQTLDRYAAVQKANKKKKAEGSSAGSPAKVKSGKKSKK